MKLLGPVIAVGLAACTYVSGGAPNVDAGDDDPPDGPAGPVLSLESTAIDLGVIPTGVPASHRVWKVTNTTGTDVPIAISVTGAVSLDGSTCASALAAHASCDVHLGYAGTTLGSLAETMTITADRVYTVPVMGTAQTYVEAAPASGGAATGMVKRVPAGTPCFQGGCYPDATAVTLHATADAGAHFAGWSDGACPSSTCAVTTSTTPRRLTADFDPGSAGFDVIFDGGGPGQVGVRTTSGLVVCDASCSVPVDDGAVIDVIAATPVELGGFSSPCPANQPTCQLAAGTSSVHVDFHHLSGETTLADNTTVQFDGLNDSIVMTGLGFDFVDASGSIVWSRNETNATLAASGDVYVLVGDQLSRYDQTGAVQWTNTAPSSSLSPTGVNVWFATGAATWELWDQDGSDLASITADATPSCATTTPDGQLYLAVRSATEASSVDLEVFDATGMRQADQIEVMADVDSCVMASDWDNHVLVTTTSVGGPTRVTRLAPGGGIATITVDASPERMAVGADATGAMAWLVPRRVTAPPFGARVARVSTAGTIGANVLDRNVVTLGSAGTVGVSPGAITVAPDGRIVVTLGFVGLDGEHTVRELFAAP